MTTTLVTRTLVVDDLPALQRSRRASQEIDRIWRESAEGTLTVNWPAFARDLGLGTGRSATDLGVEPPASAPVALAFLLAERALESIRAQQETLLLTSEAGAIPVTVESEIDLAAVLLGIPLVASCEPQVVPAALRSLAKIAMPTIARDPDERERAYRMLFTLVRMEDQFWHAAGEDRIPYATAYGAFKWFGRPGDAQPGDARICLQCGKVETAVRITAAVKGPRLCRWCAQHKPPAVTKGKTIAPAHRGKWWLECRYPGCDVKFVGRSNAMSCPIHRGENLSKAQRAAACIAG